MRRLVALTVAMSFTSPAYCVDRNGPRSRELDAAWQTVQRQQVIERYRYYVPVSAFSQRRGDDPRAHYRWRPHQKSVEPEPMW